MTTEKIIRRGPGWREHGLLAVPPANHDVVVLVERLQRPGEMLLADVRQRTPRSSAQPARIGGEAAALALSHARVRPSVLTHGAHGALLGQVALGRAGAQPPYPRLTVLSQGCL